MYVRDCNGANGFEQAIIHVMCNAVLYNEVKGPFTTCERTVHTFEPSN